MHNDLTFAAATLRRGHTECIEDGKGLRVLCLSGSLWLTQDGDPRDVVIEPGQSAVIDRDGRSVLCALNGDARFLLLHRLH